VAKNATWTSVVARLDAQGNEVYKIEFGDGSGETNLLGGVIDESGSVVLIGASGGAGPFVLGSALVPEDSTYVTKLDPAGFVEYSLLGHNRKFSYGLPVALTTVEGADGKSSVHVLGEFE